MRDSSVLGTRERPVYGGRSNAVEPRAAIRSARGCKCRSGKLFRIEAVGRFLRRVLADGESARQGLGHELVAEARLIAKRCNVHDAVLSGGFDAGPCRSDRVTQHAQIT